jgi:hypothetical protein
MILIISGEEYKSHSSSIGSFIQPPVCSSALDWNSLLSTLFSVPLSPGPSRRLRKDLWDQYKTTVNWLCCAFCSWHLQRRPSYRVPCHHGVVRPQVTGGGDGLQIWKVVLIYWISSRGQPTRGVLPVEYVTKCYAGLRTWNDSLDKRLKVRKMVDGFGTYKVRSLPTRRWKDNIKSGS